MGGGGGVAALGAGRSEAAPRLPEVASEANIDGWNGKGNIALAEDTGGKPGGNPPAAAAAAKAAKAAGSVGRPVGLESALPPLLLLLLLSLGDILPSPPSISCLNTAAAAAAGAAADAGEDDWCCSNIDSQFRE